MRATGLGLSITVRAIVAVLAATGAAAQANQGAEALRVALLEDRATQTEPLRAHYEAQDYRGLWIDGERGAAPAAALIAALRGAATHALPSMEAEADRLAALVDEAARAPERAAVAELALTRAYLAHARALGSGLLDPRRIDRDLHIVPPRPDEAALLARAAASLEAALVGLQPQDPGYAALVSALARFRALPADAWGAPAPGGPSIRPGESGERVSAIRARLVRLGDHEGAAAAADPTLYDQALVADVRAFQRRHGLNDDGVIGQRTLDAMNASVEDRIDQIAVGLERMRWTNRDKGRRHVYVNLADFTVQLVEAGETLFSERVVAGARRHRTPEFSDEMEYMVFNPTWHVPRSIAAEDILPLLQEDPDHLTKKNMRLVSRTGEPTPDPSQTDWSLYSRSDFPYAIKQAPGPGNSLGRVKFMFPNAHAIYLHDTPSKNLFAKDSRAFSRGCVRVQDPLRFAEALLAPQEAAPAARIEAILATGRETVVRLGESVPVHLDYRTAWVDADGTMQFRDDVYGRDGRILAALRSAGVEPTTRPRD